MRLLAHLSVLVLLLFVTSIPVAGNPTPITQTDTLRLNEARTVYLGNLARRDHGLPPLRWNYQLTQAARWFAWDSTENRPYGFCGHDDTNGNYPSYRTRAMGYQGWSGAENAFCGYVSPEYAIQGWMDSPGHRDNLLDPNHREIGLGYYQRTSDGRGYVVQDFGSDPVYPPVIVEHEAITTTNRNVNLYIYDRAAGSGFEAPGSATQMMIANDPCFSNATWEPYAANRGWELTEGEGWRTVYVKTRDAIGRTLTVSDTIYLGANLPLHGLADAHTSTTTNQVTLYGLDGNGLPQAQFSPGWVADDQMENFKKWWGSGERVNDASAWGGTAYRLMPGNGESFAWILDTSFIKDVPLTAYFRLKVNDNTSTDEVARIAVEGGGTTYGPVSLRGTDFAAPNQYQEFAVNFTFHTNPDDVFLKFNFWRSGTADVYVDAVSIFSTPQTFSSEHIWAVPGGNYRGQGIWVRYTNGNQFSAFSEAATSPPGLQVAPTRVSFLVGQNDTTISRSQLAVTTTCSAINWQVNTDKTWLQAQSDGTRVQISVNHAGLATGIHTGTIQITASGVSVAIPVQLTIVEELDTIYIPLVQR